MGRIEAYEFMKNISPLPYSPTGTNHVRDIHHILFIHYEFHSNTICQQI